MSEATGARTPDQRPGECSALLRFGRTERCANGFPVNAGCVGIEGAVPICCNERVCARLYPETGKPDRCVLMSDDPYLDGIMKRVPERSERSQALPASKDRNQWADILSRCHQGTYLYAAECRELAALLSGVSPAPETSPKPTDSELYGSSGLFRHVWFCPMGWVGDKLIYGPGYTSADMKQWLIGLRRLVGFHTPEGLESPPKATAPPVAEFVSYDNAGGVHIDLNAYLRSPPGQAQLKTLQSSEKGDGTP